MLSRRTFTAQVIVIAAGASADRSSAVAATGHPELKWYEAAVEMRRVAETWGDQGYGAVLVAGGAIAGHGPSRVVKDRNVDAHAERVAILDAQLRLGRKSLAGSVLYSTSRPCSLCEAAAFRAGVSRMYFGSALEDAGPPIDRTR